MNRPVVLAWGASIVLHMLLAVWFVRSQVGVRPAPPIIPLGRTITDASGTDWIAWEQWEIMNARQSLVSQAAFTTNAPDSVSSDVVAEGTTLADAILAEAARRAESLTPVDPNLQVPLALDGSLPLPSERPNPEATPEAPSEEGGDTTDGGGAEPQVPDPSPEPDEPARPGPLDAPAVVKIDVDAKTLQQGSPAVAEGMELRPRRLELNLTQRLRRVKHNPIIGFVFGPPNDEGLAKPSEVFVIRSSGDPDIDASLRTNGYRWRATGEKLDELEEGQTAQIDVQILLRRR